MKLKIETKSFQILKTVYAVNLFFLLSCSPKIRIDFDDATPKKIATPMQSTTSFSLTACNCGSTDSMAPCTGQLITVIVVAGRPNGGTAHNSVYNWAFNSGGGDARFGQFANGDYWIAPAPGKSTVTITGITTAGPGTISADADPVMESMGLLSGIKGYGNYSAYQNIIPNLPISYSTTTSLVAAIQRNEVAEGNCGTPATTGECVDSYNVVTVLPSVPTNAGSTIIRPNITGNSKVMLSLTDFDFSRLPAKSFLTGTNATGYEAMRQRWSHSTEIFGLGNSSGTYYSEGGRAFRSHILIDDYAAGVAAQWNGDMMVLFSDDNTLPEKQAALAAMLSYGFDIYNAMYNSGGVTRYWGTGAGQHLGKFLPPVFMAALSENSTYGAVLSTVGSHAHDTYHSGPQELQQANAGKNGPIWGDTPAFTGKYFQGAYWASLLSSQCYDGASGTCNTTTYGEKTQVDPYGYIDGPPNKPGTGYLSISLGPMRSFVATMYLMPEISDVVNYTDLTVYIDRVAGHGLQTNNDPCVTPDSRENPATCDAYRQVNCVYYGLTWGPVSPNDMISDCIKIATPPYTKSGRFISVDGTAVSTLYSSPQVEANWTTIRGVPTSPLGF